MSRPQEPQRPFLPFGNPFRRMSPKGSYMSPKLLILSNTFDEMLEKRIKKLTPLGTEDVVKLSWIHSAMEILCEIHTDVKALITALELPVSDWEEKWMDVYLDDSVKLLDICNAFSSEISQLKLGYLFLQCVSRNSCISASRARSSLDGWKQHLSKKNPRFDNCFSAINGLAEKLDLPKVKNSAKGKVLMQALYGVKMVTLLLCSIIGAAFSGSSNKLFDLPVHGTFIWAASFSKLQASVNTEIRSLYSSGRIVVKELEAVDTDIKKLYPIIAVEAEISQNSTSDLGKSAERLSQGLDLLAKEVDKFFQIVLIGRNALLDKIRVGYNASRRANNKVGGTMVS